MDRPPAPLPGGLLGQPGRPPPGSRWLPSSRCIVNVVDLGFVRGIEMDGRCAVIRMTLTSAACPLASILEDQVRGGLAGLDGVDGFRIDWVWVPAWRPADMTASGRDQLRAIGFSF